MAAPAAGAPPGLQAALSVISWSFRDVLAQLAEALVNVLLLCLKNGPAKTIRHTGHMSNTQSKHRESQLQMCVIPCELGWLFAFYFPSWGERLDRDVLHLDTLFAFALGLNEKRGRQERRRKRGYEGVRKA